MVRKRSWVRLPSSAHSNSHSPRTAVKIKLMPLLYAKRLGPQTKPRTASFAYTLNAKNGFSLIEVLIVVLLISLVSMAVVSAIYIGLQGVRTTYLRIHARTIATGEMEELKNMPYDSLATQGCCIYPPGDIPVDQEIIKGNTKFNVNIMISYVDDPFDGIAPDDPDPYDYKRLEVKVTEKDKDKTLAILTSDVSAKAAETESNTGILSISVINAAGDPIPLANLDVTNPTLAPDPLNMLGVHTDILGKLVIPHLPPDSGYQVKAFLPDYSTETIPNITILAQQVENKTLTIDKLSTLQITAVDNTLGTPLSFVDLTIHGDKETYDDPPVYKYETTQPTNASGQIILSDIEFDSYSIIPETGYYVSSTTPQQKVPLAPDTTLPVIIRLTTSPTAPTITSHSPKNGTSGSSVTININGTNLFDTSTVKLIKSGQPNIVATTVDANPENTLLSATFDLTGAATDPPAWDLEVRNPNDEFATQPQDFTIQ